MKALVLEQPGIINLHDIDTPQAQVGEVLVKVSAVSVCGSDIHAYKGENVLLTYPRIMGHEVCGVVEEINVDSETPLVSGDRVMLLPYIGCGHCVACRSGKPNCCRELSVYGVHHDGAMAEFFTAPASYLIKIDDSILSENAAIIEPLSISAHAVRRSGVTNGDTLLILGAGPIGLGAAEVARTLGARIILADIDQSRREFVQKVFGYEYVFNPLDSDFLDTLKDLTNGDFPGFIIDSTGNGKSMSRSINYLAYGGRMVFVGFYPDDLVIKDPEFHKRETELFGSRGATRADFQYVIGCVKAGKIEPLKFITHRAKFINGKEAFDHWVSLGGTVFKALFTIE
ncbi:MAG: zinc-binding alcohol dehydrogenase family protein [Treponema sp.]|jgi:2-desacetyl-2-hydroxyethyl bacteriochlorophyllide A dehydrogenase|nr:zinc-binding alcohol dehydrogenase family protein [Treponema sp.]